MSICLQCNINTFPLLGKSKTNVRELFDSSVPLDIDDLKAEFDNAPAPSLDSDDILRGKTQEEQSNSLNN